MLHKLNGATLLQAVKTGVSSEAEAAITILRCEILGTQAAHRTQA